MQNTFAAVAAVSAALLAGICSTEPTDDEKNASAMVDECQNFVLTELKYPGSAQFGELSAEEASSTIPLSLEDGTTAKLTHRIESWVDSQNNYGAQLRTFFQVSDVRQR